MMVFLTNKVVRWIAGAGLLLWGLCLPASTVQAQRRPTLPIDGNRLESITNPQKREADTLGFERRDDLADSITISFRYLDSLTSTKLDSSVTDYGRIAPLPRDYISLGNNGIAAFPILFSPIRKAGWDAGFHAFDVYKYTLKNTRFFQTTRPYTQLDYLLFPSGKEQVVGVLHTQNIRPNWNAGLDYRLISSSGTFKVQNTSTNNYRLFSNYQGRKKRYAAWLTILGNKNSSSENGGIRNPDDLNDPDLKRRIAVPVNLSDSSVFSNQIFSSKITTGNKQKDFTVFLRQSYDFGKRDSVRINDSITEYLFYPKLRFQHSFQYHTFSNQFTDPMNERGVVYQDSVFYDTRYDIVLNAFRPIHLQLMDEWQIIRNDFVIKQFPQTKNPGQYIEAGLLVENLYGRFTGFENSPNLLLTFPPPPVYTSSLNLIAHGEYRNKTRNKKWDALLKGNFYATGDYAADFDALATLTRFLNPKLGNIQVSFQNINRTPSYIFNRNSAFNLDKQSLGKKENLTILTFHAGNPRFSLMARNLSIANYAYFTNYYQSEQWGSLINLTQISLSTKNRLKGHLSLYSDFVVQQTAGNTPIHVPIAYTRQRVAFEGTFFKNLNLSTGLDIRYHTPYKMNHYSPVMGAFFPQDSIVIKNLPDVNLYFNFRIKSFSAYLTGENLNTLSWSQGFGFTNNNFAAPLYPTPGFIFRFGLRWGFVN